MVMVMIQIQIPEKTGIITPLVAAAPDQVRGAQEPSQLGGGWGEKSELGKDHDLWSWSPRSLQVILIF